MSMNPAPAPRQPVPGIVWPPVAGPAVSMPALQAQFRETERWAPEAVRGRQFAQIGALADYACAHSSFWRERLQRAGYRPGGSVAAWFPSLPALTRLEAQAAGASLMADPSPPAHGAVHDGSTSGSTSSPLRYLRSEIAMVFWHAIALRDALWQRRDLSAKLAVIRVGNERGRHPSWGPAFAEFGNGPGVTLDARDDIDTQVEWLAIERPQYLLTHASNLRALAARFIERGFRLDSLREARSYAEKMPDDLRPLVRKAWGVRVTDAYSASELGYIALQCPESEHYHVQSEDLLAEVVDEAGRPCAPGAVGRVVVTPLHNFAMPLLRYDTGDYAEVGAPCPCGRTLPVLTRIMGRARNMMRLPGGGTAWPGFPMTALTALPQIRRFRMIQHSLTEIEAQIVLGGPLSEAEEESLRQAIRTRLRHPFEIRFTRLDRLDYAPGRKIEDFECRVI